MTDIAPTVDIPFEEALDDLTGFELIGIEDHYNRGLEKLGGTRAMIGAVWAYENRKEKVTWKEVESRPMKEIASYFASKDPVEDSEQGKE